MIDAALPLVGWYAVLAALGACGWLPAALLCDRLPTHGVLYARPLALAVVALAVWIVASFGPAPNAVGYGTPLILGAVLALAAWSASIAWRHPEALRGVLARRGMILAGEALCLVVFALVVLARAQAPDAAGTEKPMDLMIITAVHGAARMPPLDPWLSGSPLSYYHLGHLTADLLGRLSGNAPGVAFNLATATAGALAALAVAGLAVDVLALARPSGRPASRNAMLVGAGVAVSALLLVTPLVGLGNLAAANGVGVRAWWAALGVAEVPVAAGAPGGVPGAFWWWWTSTRVLPGTITEFPAFTLLLGDPHAHLLALPIDLVAVALAVATFEGGTPLTWRRWLGEPERLLLTSVVFAAIVMTNTWDVLVYGGLWGAAAIAAFRRTGWSWPAAVTGAGRWAIAPAALALALALRFLGTIDAPPVGIAAVIGERSDPVRWLLVWLPLLLIVVAALALLRPAAPRPAVARAVPTVLAVLALWTALVIAGGSFGAFGAELVARGSGWAVIAGLTGAIALATVAAATADARLDRPLATALALLVAAAAVLLGTELFRVADAFPGRMNTVFKLWFSAWALLAVGAGALAGLAWERGGRAVRAAARSARVAVVVAGLVALGTAAFVPAMAISRAREGQQPGLDAVAHLRRADPGLYAAVEWSRDHLDARRDVVLQWIPDQPYTGASMLATASGVPALLGWAHHERQWRRAVPEAERRAAADAIYARGADPATIEVARRFGITYVYVGREERAAYGEDAATRFAAWPAVLDEGGAVLVRVPQ